jgi:hypothetical protein
MLAEREQGGGALVLADHGENDPPPLEFPDEGLEGDERLALVELAEGNALEPVVADHAAPERVVEVEDDAFGDHARGREHGVEQGLGEKRKMLEPAGRLRHVPHPGVEPLRPADRGGEKIDVVQEHVLGLARLDGQPIVDLGDNRADRIGDLQFVIAESTLARSTNVLWMIVAWLCARNAPHKFSTCQPSRRQRRAGRSRHRDAPSVFRSTEG